jgi:hypothetical protein
MVNSVRVFFLLGRGIKGRSDEKARGAAESFTPQPGETEIADFYAVIIGNQEVGRLYIPVDDPGAVKAREADKKLAAVMNRFVQAEDTAWEIGPVGLSYQLTEVQAVIFHGEKRRFAIEIGVKHFDNVRVAE